MLISLLVFSILASYYYFLYQPMLDEIAIIEKQIKDGRLKIQESIIRAKQKRDLEKKLSEIQLSMEKYSDVSVDSIDGLLQILEKQSSNSGLKIISFQPVKKAEHTEAKMIAEGSYEQLILFLNGLKVLNGQVEFSSLSIYKNQQSEELLTVNAEFLYSDLSTGGDKS